MLMIPLGTMKIFILLLPPDRDSHPLGVFSTWESVEVAPNSCEVM